MTPINDKSHWKMLFIVLRTLLVGALGGIAFELVNFPSAWLSGSMVLVVAAQFSGLKTHVPNQLRDVLFVVLGTFMGTGVNPEFLENVGDWPLSIVLLVLVIVGIMAFGFLILSKLAKWERSTSLLSSVPGNISTVLAFAETTNADTSRIAIVQSVRFFMLVVVLPLLIVGGYEIESPVGSMDSEFQLSDVFLTLLVAAIVGIVAVRLRIPGGWLTGAFAASAVLNGSGFVEIRIPNWIIIPSFVALGCVIATRFSGVTLQALRMVLLPSVSVFISSTAVTLLGAAVGWYLLDIPFGQALLAFAPGGLEVMALLAFILMLDPAFVAFHQIFRFVSMAFVVPIVLPIFVRSHRQKNSDIGRT